MYVIVVIVVVIVVVVGGYGVGVVVFWRWCLFLVVLVSFRFVQYSTDYKTCCIFVVFFVFWWGVGRVPHLKMGRSARAAVSPPISTKKININFGWGSYVVGRV